MKKTLTFTLEEPGLKQLLTDTGIRVREPSPLPIPPPILSGE